MAHRRDSVCERVKVICASSFECVHLSICARVLNLALSTTCVYVCAFCALKFVLGSTGDRAREKEKCY